MPVDFFENPEKLLANVTNFLVQGQDFNEASILLLCEIQVTLENENYGSSELSIVLTSNRAIYDII